LSSKNGEEKKRSGPAQIMSALRSQMKLHLALGIKEYPAGADLDRFLESAERKTGGPPAGVPPVPQPGFPDMPAMTTREKEEKLDLLRREMRSCTRCHLYQGRLGSVVGTAVQSCRLMVVGDWSLQEKESYSEEILFGPKEDAMLWKMMQAIHLSPETVYVTNCLKCCPGEGILPDSACEKSCFSFLEREIGLLKPGVICAMGALAARILTGSLEPLSRLRGKFSSYRFAPGIMVMPTYHPRFLLQNTEMKRATWLDLQAVAKRL
jgi:DNA polymerase